MPYETRAQIFLVPKEFGSLLVDCLGWVVPVEVSEGLNPLLKIRI